MSDTVHADVVVIGGGIAGAAAAWALQQRTRVALVELESQPGLHATGRSAAVISETSGPVEVCALAAASRSFLATPPNEICSSSLLSPRGLLWVASRDDVGRLDAFADVGAKVGVGLERLDPEEARLLVPVLRPAWIGGALYEPMAMSIDVAGLLGGFISAFRRRGGSLHLSSPAIRLDRHADGWVVVTPDAVISCTTVVDAAGAWADHVAEQASLEPLGLTPLLRTAFTFPVENAGDWPLVMDVSGHFYFEPMGPGVLASPADETPSDPCDARADVLPIARATDALFEATTLRVQGVRSSWAGLRTFTPDRLPVVGEDPSAPGFYWLAGQGGAGIKTAPALGHAIASLVCDGRLPAELTERGVEAASLSPTRFR